MDILVIFVAIFAANHKAEFPVESDLKVQMKTFMDQIMFREHLQRLGRKNVRIARYLFFLYLNLNFNVYGERNCGKKIHFFITLSMKVVIWTIVEGSMTAHLVTVVWVPANPSLGYR